MAVANLLAFAVCIFAIVLRTAEAAADTCPADSQLYITPTSLSGKHSGRRNVIIFLLPEFGQALDGFPCSLPCSTVDKAFIQIQIQMLDRMFRDGGETDIVIFHEGYPTAQDMASIRNSTIRGVDFINIDQVFSRIPDGLDPYAEQPTWQKRAKWRYHQMIRFMVQDIFQFPVMDNVDYYLRIDFDSCFKHPLRNLFSYMRGPGLPAVYMANDKLIEAGSMLPGTHLLQEVAEAYVQDHGIVPRDPMAWFTAFKDRSVFTYSNNFEISNIGFFRRPDVKAFVGRILDSLGIFRYRWGDSAIRYLSLALFAEPDELLHRKHFNVTYDHPCAN